MIDLTITPQGGTLTPGAHLNTDQAEHVIRDWRNYGTTGPQAGTWTVAVVHTIDGTPRVTAVAHIPRSVATDPHESRSVHLRSIPGGREQHAPRTAPASVPRLMAVAA